MTNNFFHSYPKIYYEKENDRPAKRCEILSKSQPLSVTYIIGHCDVNAMMTYLGSHPKSILLSYNVLLCRNGIFRNTNFPNFPGLWEVSEKVSYVLPYCWQSSVMR